MDQTLLYFSQYDAVTDTATMLIQGFIGLDFTAEAWVNELMYLEKNGVTKINVRINSGGGIVTQAYTIFSALVNSNAFITTYCTGLAASCASWIFLAGNKAVMMDYGMLFVHNPAGTDTSAKGLETVEFMRQSIITIIAKRTGNSAEKVAELMENDTFLNAETALALGFAHEVQETGILVEQVEATVENLGKMFEVYNAIPQNKILNMNEEVADEKTVDAIVEEVNEEVVVETQEVVAPEEVVVETSPVTEEVVPEVAQVEEVKVDEVTNLVDVTNQLVDVTNKYQAAQTEIETLTKVVNELRAADAGRIQEAKVKAATELVVNAIGAGKLDEASKESWVNLALLDFTNMEKAIANLKINKAGIDISNLLGVASEKKEEVPNLRELEKTDPKRVAAIYNTDRVLYNRLYKDTYGTEPK